MTRLPKEDPWLKILLILEMHARQLDFSPSVREIQAAGHFSSTSLVDYHLKKMHNEGLIEKKAKIARTIRILPKGEQLLRSHYPAAGHPAKPLSTPPKMGGGQPKMAGYINTSANFSAHAQRASMSVPILGSTFGGSTEMSFPSETPHAELGPDDTLIIYRDSMPRGTKSEDLFALHVVGDSMINAGINDGDYAILRKTKEANPGDLVVVWLDDRNETTLKYFYPEKDCIRLEPANPAYQPIMIERERANSLRIEGKVVQVVRA